MTAVQTGPTRTQLVSWCVELLEKWTSHANNTWTWLSPADATNVTIRGLRLQNVNEYTPSEPVAGYYGTGYASWGVMAQAATVGVFATLAKAKGDPTYLEHCQKGLRFLFGTHAAGPLRLTDGEKWGSGISSHDAQYAALWVEQGMLAYDLIENQLTSYDRALVKGVLTAEADGYLAQSIEGGLGPEASRAESNALKATVLARARLLYPEHTKAEQWRQKSCEYWLNAVSTESDAHMSQAVYGKPLHQWHKVANFHTHFGVTHRGFFHPSDIALTLGAMVAAALMHVRRERPIPVETFHHWNDILGLVSSLYLWDNTIACVGGQTWPRFTWDQTMLLPALAWAGTHKAKGPTGNTVALSSATALNMAAGILKHVAAEQEQNGDGSFYSQRLRALREDTDWDYLRYEAGTAFAIATTYAVLTSIPENGYQRANSTRTPKKLTDTNFLVSYKEPSLGTMWHRSASRFASWSWQACRVPAQGLVIPRSGMRMCEWNSNLVGSVRLKEHEQYHALQYHREHSYTGGFATMGLLAEQLPMWPMADKTPSLRHGIAFFVLPDNNTCVLFDLVWCVRQVNVVQNRGLLYKLANDVTNQNLRTITTQIEERGIVGLGAQAEVWRPESQWLVIDNCLFIMPLWGGQLAVEIQGDRLPAHYGFGEATLLWDEIYAPLETSPVRLHAGNVLRDTCTVYMCEVAGKAANQAAAQLNATPLAVYASGGESPYARAVMVKGQNGMEYIMAVNFDRTEVTVHLPVGWSAAIVAGSGRVNNTQLALQPASFILCSRG